MRLNYKSFGEGSPVLILHGILGMLDNWQHFAKLLAKDFHVIIADLRNHGRSPHSSVFDYQVMQDDILELLKELGIEKTSIIGHSMGGKLAMHLALNNPEIVNELIVLDIAVKKYNTGHEYIFDIFSSINLQDFTTRKDIEKTLALSIHNYAIRQLLLKNIKRDKLTSSFAWKFNLEAIKNNYSKIIDAITHDKAYAANCLFVRGGDSDYITDEDVKDIKVLFPKATIETIAGAGHWIHADKEELLYSLISLYLTRMEFNKTPESEP